MHLELAHDTAAIVAVLRERRGLAAAHKDPLKMTPRALEAREVLLGVLLKRTMIDAIA